MLGVFRFWSTPTLLKLKTDEFETGSKMWSLHEKPVMPSNLKMLWMFKSEKSKYLILISKNELRLSVLLLSILQLSFFSHYLLQSPQKVCPWLILTCAITVLYMTWSTPCFILRKANWNCCIETFNFMIPWQCGVGNLAKWSWQTREAHSDLAIWQSWLANM